MTRDGDSDFARIEVRAEILRAQLAAVGEDVAVQPSAALRAGLWSGIVSGDLRREVTLIEAHEPEDDDLLCELVVLGREVRARQWQALERLLSFVPPGGTLAEVWAAPQRELPRVLAAFDRSGLLWDPPAEG